MYRRERSHLEEWATLLETDISEELLDERSETVVSEEWPESSVAGDEAR